MCSLADLIKIEKIGSGKSADVYKVQHQNTCRIQALKVFKNLEEYQNEKNLLQHLKHDNLVRSYEIEDPNHILIEYCENRTMLDFINLKIQVPEEVVRYYFQQLVSGVDYIHQQGYVHRDIKLENMLLDSQFQLKLADFGFSVPVIRGQKLAQIFGTNGYFAPEQIQKQEHYGQASDVFQMGVVLFCMMNGTAPFLIEASQKDPYFKLIIQRQYSQFWKHVEKSLKKTLSLNFKDLINKMLANKVEERITIEEIKQHPWLQKCENNQDIINTFMEQLKQKLSNSNLNFVN